MTGTFQTVEITADEAFNTPSQVLSDNGVRYVALSLIPQTHLHAAKVYFVSGHNGDEFGQFATAQEALDSMVSA